MAAVSQTGSAGLMIREREETRRLIGVSAAIRHVGEQTANTARSDAKVLITGESGVGKDVVAELIHQGGPRRLARFVTINCAGVPDSLLESELFGHVRGAFTGAYRDKTGLLEMAHRGTVFMDEVGEMSLRMQAVLLRFLETGEVHRVGSDIARARVDVRVVAATNRNLRDCIDRREFREDLYFRLNVIHLTIPPLRERREDIRPLLDHFFARYCAQAETPVPVLTPQAMARLMSYHWPGNVRELQNVVQRITLSRKTSPITVDDLPSEMVQAPATVCAREPHAGVSQALFDRVVNLGESFWAAAYEPFRSRDLTRKDLRGMIRVGLERTRGSYRQLVELFGLPATDYKRFVNFLRTSDCLVSEFRLRTIAARPPRNDAADPPAPADRADSSGASSVQGA